jgi:hypothetical protein
MEGRSSCRQSKGQSWKAEVHADNVKASDGGEMPKTLSQAVWSDALGSKSRAWNWRKNVGSATFVIRLH